MDNDSPLDAEQMEEDPQPRATATYASKDERFTLKSKSFVADIQYANLYFARAALMNKRLLETIQRAWPNTRKTKVLDLQEEQEVALIGTLYKEQKLKPSILDEYTKDRGIDRLVGRTKFAEADDVAILEDEGARVVLRGDCLPTERLVTGVSLAVRGSAAPGGDHFQVMDVRFAATPPQKPLRPPPGPHKYVALLSGLGVGDDGGNPQQLALVVDYLTGLLGRSGSHGPLSQVVRAVIAGGLLKTTEGLAQPTAHNNPRHQAVVLAPIKETDVVLSQLAAAMPVDVMPGGSDPTNHSLPQQPLHGCLLPGSGGFATMNRVTNPHDFEVDGVHFLGTSGQNLDDVYRYSAEEQRIELLESVLRWGHLAPTAPDTLATYPFSDQDPFILDAAPHVLFAGNQPEFATRVATGPDGQRVRLVCVPKFSASGVLLLVNLATLEVDQVAFDTFFSG